MRYLRLTGTFIRGAFQNESAFRFNFFMKLFNAVLSLAGGIGGIFIIYSNNESLNGWSFAETLAVLGVYMLVQAFAGLSFGPSLNKLGGMGGEIETGTFDYTLLRPVSKQFYISLREWSLWSAFDIAESCGVIVAAVWQRGLSVSAIMQFLFALVISLGIYYAILLFFNSVAFWYRGTYLTWIINDVMQAGRYPVGIYPWSVRLLLTWVFPVGFIVSIPADALMQKAQPMMLLAGLGVMLVLFTLSTVFFNLSLRKYSSASS